MTRKTRRTLCLSWLLLSQLSHKLEAADDDDLNYQRAHLNNTSTDEFKTVNPLIKHGKKIQKGFGILRIQK